MLVRPLALDLPSDPPYTFTAANGQRLQVPETLQPYTHPTYIPHVEDTIWREYRH
jgi:hypothetical protein